MQIKTGKPQKETKAKTEVSVPPDRKRVRRRRGAQKLPKAHSRTGSLLSAARFVGKIAVIAVICASALGIYRHAYRSGRFTLHRIEFVGCSRVDPGELQKIVHDGFPSNLLEIDLEKLRRRLELETWVRKVEIRRLLPSTLEIHVMERKPSIIAELRGNLVLTDDEGILLDLYGPEYGKLDVPVFRGMVGNDVESYRIHQEENEARVRLGLAVLKALGSGPVDYTGRISEVDLSDPGNVKLLLVDDTAEVILGDKEFQERFHTFIANMSHYQALKSQYSDIASVDLRFDGQIIYRPRSLPAAGRENLGAATVR